MAILNSYTPMQQGATLPALQYAAQDDNGNPINITGATLTLYFYDPETNQYVQGNGAWMITNGAGGLATYAWDVTDTANSFTGMLVIHIMMSGGGTYIPDPSPFEIAPLFFTGQS
jgi:hypothetical protein